MTTDDENIIDSRPICEICGTYDNLRRHKLMRRKDPPVVCGECAEIWYEYGLCTASEIRKVRESKHE